MKLNLNSFVILCSAFFCSACDNSTVKTNTEDDLYKSTIRLPDMDTLQNIYLSEIADSVYYVALSEKPFITHISQIETTDNSIVLKDRNGSLKLYDADGNFKREIGGVGRGAGEYNHPLWTVNKQTDSLYLNARFVRRDIVSVYSLSDDSDGKMVGGIRNPTLQKITETEPTAFYSFANNILVRSCIFPHNDLELAIYNLQTNTIIDSLPNYHNGGNMMLTGYCHSISHYKDELYYMNIYSDTLYKVTEKEITPFAIFDFGKYKFPLKITKFKNIKDFEELGRIEENSIRLKSILRVSNTLYVKFQNAQNLFISALNLDDNTVRYCKPYFINDLDNGPDFVDWGERMALVDVSIEGNKQIIDISKLKLAADDGGNDNRFSVRFFPNNKMAKKMKNIDEFQRLFDKSTEESNPIIQFLNFKD